jgi:hypothetical protein
VFDIVFAGAEPVRVKQHPEPRPEAGPAPGAGTHFRFAVKHHSMDFFSIDFSKQESCVRNLFTSGALAALFGKAIAGSVPEFQLMKLCQ